jgi:hypothetical protein
MADTTIKPGTAVVGRRGWHHHRDPARRAAGVCAIYLHADSGHLRATVFRDGRDEVDFDNVDAIVGSPAASAFAETKAKQYDASLLLWARTRYSWPAGSCSTRSMRARPPRPSARRSSA